MALTHAAVPFGSAESFVFIGEEPLPLLRRPLQDGRMEVRSHYRAAHPDAVVHAEGKDYVIDYEARTIRRTPGSRIPDGAAHPMYGIDPFDHTKFPEYSNQPYTVYADYTSASFGEVPVPPAAGPAAADYLSRSLRKLANGEPLLYVVYGDSISTGGEASEADLAYFGRFAELLRSLYPQGQIRIENKSIGGETSAGGLRRVLEDVVALQPDLVTVGYGMNDQNKDSGTSTTLEEFERNLRGIVDAVRTDAGSDIILVTPCEPNPRWRHTSGRTPLYADVIRGLGASYGIGVADAHALWVQALAAGKTPESLLLNNINHPNDYGHEIYARAFVRMLAD